MSLGPGQIDPRDTFIESYKGRNIYGHADTPTYYFFYGAILYDGFNSEMEARFKVDELAAVGQGIASPVDVVPPGEVPAPIEDYRGVPIYQQLYAPDLELGIITPYYKYFFFRGLLYTDFREVGIYASDFHAKIDELLGGAGPPVQPPYTPPIVELPPIAPVTVSVPPEWGWLDGPLNWLRSVWEDIAKSDRDARERVAVRSIAETRSVSLEQAAEIRETTKEAYKPAGLGGWLWSGLSESMGELVKNSMNEALKEVVRLAPEATGHSPEEKKKLNAALEPYANSIVDAVLAEVDPAKYAHSPITPEEAKNSLNLIMGGIVGVEIGLFVAHAFLEGATLGQIEALSQIENMVISKLGLNQVASAAITIPLNELILKRAQQYYAAQYTPEIPSYQDLIEMVVKEVIPLNEFKAQMKFLGYSEQWSQYIWDKHFIPPSLTDILTAWRRGLITEKRVDELMILVDLDPRFKEIFDTRKYVTPPLSLTRFMFETGAISAETVRANVALEGYAPEYVDGITSYIVNFQARRWRTRYLQALSTGMTKGVVSETEVLKATLEAGYTEDVAKWIVETSKVRAKIAAPSEVAMATKLLSVADMKRLYLKSHITNDVLRTDMMTRGYSYDDTTLLITMLDEEKVVTAAGGSKVALSEAELVDAWRYEEITEDQLRTELQLRGLSLAEVEILIRTKKKKWGVEEGAVS